MTRLVKLLALCCAVAACTDGSSLQVITGRVDTSKGALAIRAIADDDVVTATPVRTDGSFTLTLPAGTTYRLEVLTTTGVKNIVQRSGNILRDLSFKVCQPSDPFDVGGVGDPSTDGLCMPGDANCTPCDPMAGMECEQPPLPPTCDPMLDPNCKCDVVLPDGTCCTAGDPSCGPLPCMDGNDPSCCDANGFCPPPPCEPGDPMCEPPKCDPTIDPMCCYADGTCPPPDCQPGDPNCAPPCDPANDPMCEPPPPPCDPTTDPMCKCNEDGTCPPLPCSDPSDPNCCMPGPDGTCGGTCTDPMAPGCAPPCENPMDPSTCKDPCADDPASCGCMVEADGTANCWPQPQPCCDESGTSCDPTDGMAPDNVPGDFGCEGN